MSHECQVCGQQCFCDIDDCEIDGQPPDCPHLLKHGVDRVFDAETGVNDYDEDD